MLLYSFHAFFLYKQFVCMGINQSHNFHIVWLKVERNIVRTFTIQQMKGLSFFIMLGWLSERNPLICHNQPEFITKKEIITSSFSNLNSCQFHGHTFFILGRKYWKNFMLKFSYKSSIKSNHFNRRNFHFDGNQSFRFKLFQQNDDNVYCFMEISWFFLPLFNLKLKHFDFSFQLEN